jgi:hypothetical protein
MESIIFGISSFFVTGAVIVVACNIWMTISQMRSQRASRPATEAPVGIVQETVSPHTSPFAPSAQFEMRRHMVQTNHSQPFRLA